MGKFNKANFLAKLKLIIYTRSFTNCSQTVNKQEYVISGVINNVEGIGVRKSFLLFSNNSLLISCGEVSLFGHYFTGWEEREISKIICCPEQHIKKR